MAELNSIASLLGPTEFGSSGLLTNCKLYYKFEDTSTTTVTDSSGNSSTGTASRTNINGGATGKFGYCGTFASASSDKVTITDNSILKPTGNFTLGAWIKTSTTGVYQHIIQSYAEGSTFISGIALLINNSNVAQIISGKNSGSTAPTHYQVASTTTNPCDGVWHFLVGTWDGSNLKIYIDGRLEGTTAWANAPVYQATNYVRVGCGNLTGSDTRFFNGSLDDTFLLNGTALTADQVSTIYGALAYYRLENVNDSKNSYTLTNNNTVTFTTAKYLNGADFGTTNTNKSLSIVNNFGITNGACTISMWANIRTAIGDGAFWELAGLENSTSDNLYGIAYTRSGSTRSVVFQRYRQGVSSDAVSYNLDLGTNTWYQLAVTYDGTNLRGYLNGALVAGPSSYTGDGTGITANSFAIGNLRGAAAGNTYYSSIYADDVGIWNRALSDTEILQLFSANSKALFFSQL